MRAPGPVPAQVSAQPGPSGPGAAARPAQQRAAAVPPQRQRPERVERLRARRPPAPRQRPRPAAAPQPGPDAAASARWRAGPARPRRYSGRVRDRRPSWIRWCDARRCRSSATGEPAPRQGSESRIRVAAGRSRPLAEPLAWGRMSACCRRRRCRTRTPGSPSPGPTSSPTRPAPPPPRPPEPQAGGDPCVERATPSHPLAWPLLRPGPMPGTPADPCRRAGTALYCIEAKQYRYRPDLCYTPGPCCGRESPHMETRRGNPSCSGRLYPSLAVGSNPGSDPSAPPRPIPQAG